MELHQVRYFLAVASTLNFTRAAEECHVAQPSLTRAIKQLEEELGALETRLSQPDEYEDDSAVAEDGTRHQELQKELAYLYREWERNAAEAG